MSLDLSKLSSKELKELLAKKREEEHQAALKKREAYEGIRAELVQRVENKVRAVCEEVKGLHKFCVDELGAFRDTLAEYGQLRNPGQLKFTVQEGNFRIEVKTCKIKKFDERADVAASRLIEFLQSWIKEKKDGTNDPMYQLAMPLLEERFNNPEYSSIMSLFKESHLVEASSTNFYFYEKNDLGVWVRLEPSFNRL